MLEPAGAYEKPSTRTYVPPGKPGQQVPHAQTGRLQVPLAPAFMLVPRTLGGAAFPLGELKGE